MAKYLQLASHSISATSAQHKQHYNGSLLWPSGDLRLSEWFETLYQPPGHWRLSSNPLDDLRLYQPPHDLRHSTDWRHPTWFDTFWQRGTGIHRQMISSTWTLWHQKNRDQQAGDLTHFDKHKKRKEKRTCSTKQAGDINWQSDSLTGTKGAGRSKGRQAWRLRPLPQCRNCLRTSHLLIRNILLWDTSNASLPPPPPPYLQWRGSEEAWRRKRCNQCL